MSNHNTATRIVYHQAEEWFIKGYNAANGWDKITCYRKAIELSSDNPGLWEILGHTYLESGNYQEALQCLQQVSGDRASHPDYLCILGDVYVHLKQIDAASSCFEKARENDHLHKKSWTKTGNLLDDTGRFNEARDCFLMAGRLPEDPGNYLDSLYVQIIEWFDRRGEGPQDLNEFQLKLGIQSKISILSESVRNRYRAIEYIGKGGFGEIYKAIRSDGDTVAIKIPTAFDSQTAKSFTIELDSWRRLSHPNIVRLLDYSIKPHPYFEMELCERSLADLKMPIDPKEAAWLIFHICEGLKTAHAQKIIHRDLKPHNILMKNGVPKISDWGLSKVLSESRTITTISFSTLYAAPEQINNTTKDERTDIWQVGVVLYELITGRLPFNGDSQTGIMTAITTAEPEPPVSFVEIPSVLESIILQCLEKQPSNRYQSVLELQRAIAGYLKINYTEELKRSISTGNTHQAAHYCCDLILVHLRIGEGSSAFAYLMDLLRFTKGGVRDEIQTFADNLEFMIENNIDLSDDVVRRAELLMHRV